MTKKTTTRLAIAGTDGSGASEAKVSLKVPYSPAALRRWQRPSFAGYTPAQLSSLLRGVERGQCADWAHFCSHMIRTDAHLKSVTETRIMGVAGARWEIEAGYSRPGEEALAEEAADFWRRSLDDTPGFEDTVASLVKAEDIGWAGAGHQWYRNRGEWHSVPAMIHPADIAFANDWSPIVRTWDDPQDIPEEIQTMSPGGTGGGTWLKASHYKPGTWIFHIPGGIGETPNLAGDLHSVAWIWMFKHWSELWRQTALERFANPFVYGRLGQNATDVARQAMIDGLEKLSGDHMAVFEMTEGITDPIGTLDVSGSAGTAHTEAMRHMDEQYSKALLGSGLNVEVGNTGGNRSLGESQRDTTIIPRLNAFSRRLATTLERDWAKPAMRLNAHLFGGRVPPTPRIKWVLVDEDRPEISQMAVDAGVVRKDELRAASGLEAEGGEWGQQFVVPIAKTAPSAFSKAEEVAEPRAPFSRPVRKDANPEQMRLPLTSPRRRHETSPTSSASRTQIASVPFESSDGHES